MSLRRKAAVGLGLWVALATPVVHAQHRSVAATVHNLSATGPGEIRAVEETQICKFCHIPHNARQPRALWSQALSRASYQTAPVRTGSGPRVAAPQPDGSSRLCLSCHDGTVALGEVSGRARRISMTGAQTLGPGRRGFLGTDLSGSHPVSFVVPDGDLGVPEGETDMGLRSLGAIRGAPGVSLDAAGKMQCTTCHDPHRDQYYDPGNVPRFWVRPTVSEVCATCHVPR